MRTVMPIVVESITETTVRDFFWPRSSVENPQGCRELGDVAILTHRRTCDQMHPG